jgi:hypothetical protein
MDLESLVQAQAKQAGMSSKQAKQALKKLREGGLMAQIAPHLQERFSDMNPNMTPRDRLRAKINNSKLTRTTKEVKTAAYEKQREEVHQREADAAEAKEKAKEAVKRKKKAHNQKLKELEQKLGKVPEEMYIECLARQRAGIYKDDSERNRDRNIIDLYSKQQEFTDSINMDDLDMDD